MKKTILLVDDEADLREVLDISLSHGGYEVFTAENGVQALDILKEKDIPVVITDIKMPGIDGIDLLRKIKNRHPETEVIMLTGHGDLDLAIKSLKHEATDFITKPINDDALEMAMVRAFDKISMRKKLKEYDRNRAMYDIFINELIQEDVLVIGSDYRILDINETLLNKLGLKRKEAVGRYCYEITHRLTTPCSGEDHKCPLKETLMTRKPTTETHIHKDKDNKNVYYSISAYPLFENGEVIGAIELSRDITADINGRQAMMQKDKLASIGRLSAGVAHEINNPLTTILTTAMLIQEDIDPDNPMYEELETITNETLRCRKIVASLLDFARQTKPAKKHHNINDIITECIQLTRKQAEFKDIQILNELSEKVPKLLLDKEQIQQAFINLILNATDATDPGGTITVSTDFSPDNQLVNITVSDTGKGIAAEVLDKIFEPFFTTREIGTGLGLAITHGIIGRHGGDIRVHSRPGEGTTFTIRLPHNKGN
ncbi:MAG: response regulator [Deltaproteobacteria bacterium]|jgi:PAS domain S-box-containing protein|nr:response regulator [Deltaproteobacteria bacterium]MBW2449395.1 response regulator [Deltaproteobacteria bacterium]